MSNIKSVLSALLLLFPSVFVVAIPQRETRHRNFDFDWKFSLSDNPQYAQSDYNDADWKDVQLPHDWSITLPFDRRAGGSAGWLPGGIGWYRKTFSLPATDKDKHITILFDGVFHQSDVYINGKHLGFHPYGFTPFEYDITPYIHTDGKPNLIAVRVDHSGEGARWYTGSGIYRHVKLVVTNPVHVATYGTYITTPVVSAQSAEVHIRTEIINAGHQEVKVSTLQRILDKQGKEVASVKSENQTIPTDDTINVSQQLIISNPAIWSIEAPNLYTVETTVKVNGRTSDVYLSSFGVRTIRWDKDKGFFLNDKHMKLQGFALHQDGGLLGSAVLVRSDERKLEIVKEFGVNAIRCAHNPFSTEFLDLCDRLGFVVIDEAFDKWKSGYYDKYFDEWWQRDLQAMLLRDRNHPSIILWSIGNEVTEAWGDQTIAVARTKMLHDFVHAFEPTRPTNLAAQNNHKDEFASVVDVIGYNYLEARLLSDRLKYPNRKFLITEELPYFSGAEGNIRSYTPINPWNIIGTLDFIAGGFIWSGVDYVGESHRYVSKGWPEGIFDLCVFEKPRGAYLRAMWNEKPSVGISVVDASLDMDIGRDLWQWPKMAALWTFPERYRGQMMDIRTATNCDRVELFLNGRSMGVQKTKDFTNNTILWNLPYTPGELEARGYNGNSADPVATYKLVTSGKTDKAILTPDRTILKADGQDLSYIAVKLVDAKGHLVQTDDRMVSARIEGAGILRGIDSGDLRRTEPFGGSHLSTSFGRAIIIVQSTRQAGGIKLTVEVEGVTEPYIIGLKTNK